MPLFRDIQSQVLAVFRVNRVLGFQLDCRFGFGLFNECEQQRLLLLYLPLPASWAEEKERAKLGCFSNFNWFSHILIQPSFP